MFRLVAFLMLAVGAMAFVPAGRFSGKTSMKMALYDEAEGLIGSDIEWPDFDPWELSKGASEDDMFWYRSAELKHGRIAMLAALGQITQSYFQLGDPVFSQSEKPIKAIEQVCAERPLAGFQILLAIFAVEAFGQFQQINTGVPGDLNFDPLGLKPDDDEAWEKVQLRELKNGRLAMLAIAGMLYTELITGNGVIEAWRIGAVSPFNDGAGIF